MAARLPAKTAMYTSLVLITTSLNACLLAQQPAKKQTKQDATQTELQAIANCKVDLSQPGTMKDVLSNALMLGIKLDEARVNAFLANAETKFDRGDSMVKAAAAHFNIPLAKLKGTVLKFKHCNCDHSKSSSAAPETPTKTADSNTVTLTVSKFAEDVTMHVVLHEMGHALVREFDLPILANEETLADAFATHYLVNHLPNRAADVLHARIRSLMHEAKEVPRNEWTIKGEHNHDARRAYQIAALAIAADSEKYSYLGKEVGMSENDIRKAKDYGSEIHRSWRRILKPLWMPEGKSSTESRIRFDEGGQISQQIAKSSLNAALRTALGHFDWHSQVTIFFAEGDGGAGWSRSNRTITVNSQYIERFIRQGQAIEKVD